MTRSKKPRYSGAGVLAREPALMTASKAMLCAGVTRGKRRVWARTTCQISCITSRNRCSSRAQCSATKSGLIEQPRPRDALDGRRRDLVGSRRRPRAGRASPSRSVAAGSEADEPLLERARAAHRCLRRAGERDEPWVVAREHDAVEVVEVEDERRRRDAASRRGSGRAR